VRLIFSTRARAWRDSPGGQAQQPGITVNQQTHTVYVANSGSGTTGTVTVLDERTCNATTTTGCANIHTLQVPGGNPAAIAVNPATDTVYAATDPHSGPTGPDQPSTVSVFNGATCNATTTAGCGHTPPAVTVGFGAAGIAFDPSNRTVAVTNIEDTSVSVINAATCNATTTSCHSPQPLFPVGRAHGTVAINPAVRTIYTANGDSTVSIIPATR
jgi:DNA-binding beta-propeller fold protein YncE